MVLPAFVETLPSLFFASIPFLSNLPLCLRLGAHVCHLQSCFDVFIVPMTRTKLNKGTVPIFPGYLIF